MPKRIITLTIFLFVLFALPFVAVGESFELNLKGNDTAKINCDGNKLTLARESATKVTINCKSKSSTPIPSTPIPPTPIPPTPIPPTPSSGIPPCPDHDPTKWHPLYDAERNCHYNHEHIDDPRLVDDIFGPVGAFYGGQEISYPWQTFSSQGQENDVKHGGYAWLVRRGIDCKVAQGEFCITDFRTQIHVIMASIDAVVRYHSFWVEARLCRDGQCGIVRTGGWADYNLLTVDDVHVPLPGDGNAPVFARRRDHRTGEFNRYDAVWYGGHGNGTSAFVSVRGETWGLVTAEDPYQLNLFCPDFRCKQNGSLLEMHILGFIIGDWLDEDGKVENGLVAANIYTDRYGNIVKGCTELGLDCVPLILENVPIGEYQYRDDIHGFHSPEYDTSPPGEYWIEFPN